MMNRYPTSTKASELNFSNPMISTFCQYLGLNECVEENQTKEFCTKILRHWSSITQSNSQSNFEISLPIHHSSALYTMCRNGNFGLVFVRGEILLKYMIFVYHWTS